MLISVLFSTCIFFKTGEITDEDSARQVACGVSINVLYTIFDFNEVDMRIYLPEKNIIH